MLDNYFDKQNFMLNDLDGFINNRILQSLCEYELKIYQGRIDRMNTREQRYFNSTPIRNAFASLMVVATCNNKFYTITEIVNHLRSNRQSVSTMVDECRNEGWVNVSKVGNKLQCSASLNLVKSFNDYIHFSMRISKEYIQNLEMLKIKKSISEQLS
ncbi:hypothetical protein PQZ43_00850 [Alphaproteobacteria bacterium]|nr:hypothetical protein [Alphaproteobacteria bacterium]